LTWDDQQSVASFIFKEIENDGLEDLFYNKLLVGVLNAYKSMHQEGNNPTEKNFLYHEDPKIGQMAVSLLTDKHQISPNWSKFYKGDIPQREDLYREEVRSSMTYLKLRKVKRLILENQADLEKDNNEEDTMILLQTHLHLKQAEMELMKSIGTVIFR